MAGTEILVVDLMDAVCPDIRPTALSADAPLAAPLGVTMLVQVVLWGGPGRLKLHRFRSKWSAEGRHEVRFAEELQFERPWLGNAASCERFGQVRRSLLRQKSPPQNPLPPDIAPRIYW